MKLCQRVPHRVGRVVLVAPGGLGRYRFVSKARLLASREATKEAFDKLLPGPLAYVYSRPLRQPAEMDTGPICAGLAGQGASDARGARIC